MRGTPNPLVGWDLGFKVLASIYIIIIITHIGSSHTAYVHQITEVEDFLGSLLSYQILRI